MDCDVKVCFLWNTPFKFLSLLYTFLNFTTPIAKENEIHSSNVFVQLWYQITLQRLWAITGIIRDCGLWWESPVKWKQSDAHGTGILPEVPWWAWDSSLMGYRPRGLGTGVVDGQHTGFWPSFTVKPWHRQGLTNSRAGVISWQWYQPLTAERLISGVRYTLVCIREPSSFIKSG